MNNSQAHGQIQSLSKIGTLIILEFESQSHPQSTVSTLGKKKSNAHNVRHSRTSLTPYTLIMNHEKYIPNFL